MGLAQCLVLISLNIKCSLNTIKLKQALHHCCELAKRWKVCYAFSNSTDPKAKLFSSKPLLLMFFTSHLVAQFRNLEAVQETSVLFPPPVHTQTHLRSHRVMRIPSHQHLLDPAPPPRILSATTSAVPLRPHCCCPRPPLLACLPASSLASLCAFSRAIFFQCKLVRSSSLLKT